MTRHGRMHSPTRDDALRGALPHVPEGFQDPTLELTQVASAAMFGRQCLGREHRSMPFRCSRPSDWHGRQPKNP